MDLVGEVCMGPDTEACTPWRAPGNGRCPGGGSGARAGKLYCCRPDAESAGVRACVRVLVLRSLCMAPCMAVCACIVCRPHRVTSTTAPQSRLARIVPVECRQGDSPIKSILPTVGSLFQVQLGQPRVSVLAEEGEETDHSDRQPGGKGGCGIACEAISAISARLSSLDRTRARGWKESRVASRLARPRSTRSRRLGSCFWRA